MRRALVLVPAALAALGASTSSRAGEERTPIVKLTVADESGVDHLDHPVTVGVPLPEGKVDRADRLVLLEAAGKAIPCQITELARWLDGKSVKWVHATWLQSVKARGKAEITLAALPAGAAAPEAETGLKARAEGDKVTVQTGYVKFVVSGARFGGFEAAWFDPTGQNNFTDANQVIGGAGGGSHLVVAPKESVTLENEHPRVTGGTKVYSSVSDPEGSIEIEEQGSHRVVLKAVGRHMADGERALDYIVRFYAYASSPLVRVSHVFVSRQGEKPTDFHWMAGLNLDVPTKLAGGRVTFGTEKHPILAAAPAAILQDTSDHFVITAAGRQLVDGKGKSTKPLTTGWLDLRKGNLGLAAGIKWFWQMNPKELSIDENGLLRVGLYPLGSRPLEVYRGQSRTHYVTFLFHDGNVAPARLNAVFAGEQRPLRAWAPPKYYCRDTHCFGYSVEDHSELFGDDWPRVKKHNDVMFESLKMLLVKIDGNTYGPREHSVTRDSYGVYAWGDRYHWAWKSFGVSPLKSHQWRQSWAGNYYDYPYSMLQQFLRTGERLYLERYWSSAVQIGDVHTTNWHPEKHLIGGCRYCPPRNFVAYDDGRVATSREFNHYKAQSVFAHWYLTGDRRSLEHCRMLANNALNNHAADSGWAARGIGHQMAGLWCAYELWRDPKYFDRMKGLAYRAMAQFKKGKYRKGGFHDGIANEGLCYYYWVSGDKAVIDTFLAGYPRNKGRSSYPNMSLGLAVTWRETGEERFREWAWKALSRKKPSSRVHNPGCQYRGNANALFFLAEVSKDWKPYTGPVGNGGGPERP